VWKRAYLYTVLVDGKLSGGDLLAGVEPLHIFNPEKWTEANLGGESWQQLK